jgi:multidrug efflux pump subunit AcrB
MSDAPRRKRERAAVIGRIVGRSLRSRGVVLAMAAAAERLSPLLLTTLATALAVVPLVARGMIPGREFLQPMVVVVLGGLVTTTLLNLLFTPALNLRFGPSSERRLDAAQ